MVLHDRTSGGGFPGSGSAGVPSFYLSPRGRNELFVPQVENEDLRSPLWGEARWRALTQFLSHPPPLRRSFPPCPRDTRRPLPLRSLHARLPR